MKNPKTSKSFSLIEILVSLIVIGIVATTFPIILQTTVKSSKNTAREEIFYQEFSLLNLINSLYFDQNNTIGDNYYKELNATKGDSDLLIHKYSNNEYNTIGKYQMNNNEFRSGSNLTVSHIGIDKGEIKGDEATYNDIDDYNDFNETLTSFGRLTLVVHVKYIDDNADYNKDDFNFTFDYNSPANLTNIKLITVSVKQGSNEINLSYPAMNIGASKFLSLDDITQ